MTIEERAAILPKIPVGIETVWRDVGGSFVALKAHPCPFFIFGECVVYDVRPYNCRRFACLRPDPKTEPFEMTPVDPPRNPTGCENADARINTSRAALRLMQKIQRKASRWGLRHGWSQ